MGTTTPPITPTIVFYCTIGYRSGREAQRLVDELTSPSSLVDGIELGKSLDIKNLDGILSYSFVPDAPPLIMSRNSQQNTSSNGNGNDCGGGGGGGGGGDGMTTMTTTTTITTTTRNVHSYGKEWSVAMNPDYDVVYFNTISSP